MSQFTGTQPALSVTTELLRILYFKLLLSSHRLTFWIPLDKLVPHLILVGCSELIYV